MEQHPVLLAMAHLKYDAVGLGNHEFNFGLQTLASCAEIAQDNGTPFLCANVLRHKAKTPKSDVPWRTPWTIIPRDVIDPDTRRKETLNIGVLSVLPPQVAHWDGAQLAGQIETRDMVKCARAALPEIRKAGADLIVLLAHTGIDPTAEVAGAENAALPLAALDGVDAIIAGHTHRTFPEISGETNDGIDHARGTLNGKPAVMPGYRGSHVGLIDLFLHKENGAWMVDHHRSEARSLSENAPVPEDQKLVRKLAPSHAAALVHMAQPIGATGRPIHSYLSLVQSDLSTPLVAAAQREAIQIALAGSEWAALPLLSAAAPYQTGGRAGAQAFTDISAGPLTMRQAFDLYPFPNTLCAVLATGADLVEWLERATSGFQQINPGAGDQPLLDPRFPGHAADTLFGLTYSIDLTEPPAFDPKRKRIANSQRVRDVAYQGQLVQKADRFVIAVNTYRAFGGGPYRPVPEDRIILNHPDTGRTALAKFLQTGGADRVPNSPSWHLLPVAGASGVFQTGAGLLDHPQDIAALGLQEIAPQSGGFCQIRLPLDPAACESAA